ncbi:MAG TPA: fibronectin type III domain-containing protein [Blastocatellia bacterium]|nr:fibronectin type III domain-containing protein [Blastocatellia bacterium]
MPRLIRHFCLLPFAFCLIACGKVGAPIPPSRITERTAELTAIQRGGEIILTWPAPALVQKESSSAYIARAEVYRLIERRNEEPVLDADDYEESAQMIGFIDRAKIEAQAKALGHLEFRDSVNLSQPAQLANLRLRYAVRYVNKREQHAAFSNTVSIEPAPGIALPPTNLAATAPAQDEVLISWSAPEANVDGSQPASIIGYNIYRRKAKSALTGERLNSDPIAETSFTDKDFEYQMDYVYTVRAVSQGPNGLIESADSLPLQFTPVDRFAPAAPDPVSIASANGVISLFWPSNSERDVVGYNVYRAASADAAEKDWIKLTAQPITTTTYHDDRVVVDQTYYYRVTAVDRFDNESAPSKIVSETAHP